MEWNISNDARLSAMYLLVVWQDVSKANSGGLNTFRRPAKVTRAYELRSCPQRCPVRLNRLYEVYNSRCPENRPHNAFYLKPLTKYSECRYWYAAVPVGVNMLGNVVKNLCKAAGFDGYFTNHSLRATAATRLFEADVDEQLIKLKTGHTSDAVRSYKRPNDRQLCTISDIVAGKHCKPDCTSAKAETMVNSECDVSIPRSVFQSCSFNGDVHVHINSK